MSLVPLPLPQVTDDAERRVGDSISPLSPSLPNQADLSASPIILSAALNKLADMARLALQHQQDTFQQFVKFVKDSEVRKAEEHKQALERERSQAHELLQQRLVLVEAQHSQERLQQELRHTQETLERLRGQGQKETDLASSLLTNPQTKSSKLPLGQKKRGRTTVSSASNPLQPPPKKPIISAGWPQLPPFPFPPLPSLLPTLPSQSRCEPLQSSSMATLGTNINPAGVDGRALPFKHATRTLPPHSSTSSGRGLGSGLHGGGSHRNGLGGGLGGKAGVGGHSGLGGGLGGGLPITIGTSLNTEVGAPPRHDIGGGLGRGPGTDFGVGDITDTGPECPPDFDFEYLGNAPLSPPFEPNLPFPFTSSPSTIFGGTLPCLASGSSFYSDQPYLRGDVSMHPETCSAQEAGSVDYAAVLVSTLVFLFAWKNEQEHGKQLRKCGGKQSPWTIVENPTSGKSFLIWHDVATDRVSTPPTLPPPASTPHTTHGMHTHA